MMTRAAEQAGVFGEQPVEAGDADVVQPIDGVAHDLGGDRRFLGDRQIGGAGGGDERWFPCRVAARRRRERDGAGQFVELCAWDIRAARPRRASASVRVTSRL